MANKKISDAAFVVTTDITTIDGLAGYSGTANSKISGNDLVNSLEENLDLTDFTQFTGSAGQVLTINGAASGLTWSTIPSATTPDIADVLTEGDTSNAGQKIAFVDSTFTGNTRLQASGLISSYGGNFTIQHTQGGTLRIENFNEAGTDPIILDANDGYIRMQSSVQLLTNDILDSNDLSGTAGQVLSSKGSGSGTEWITPAGVSSFTNLTAGDVVKWSYEDDGPNIELITTQDPDPAITLDNVITMWDNTTNTASDISDIPDGATGTLIVHPTANPYFNFPTGSKLSDASNIRLDGATKVLRWLKEGDGADPTLSPTAAGYGCLYWAGFENFTTAAVIPGPDIEPAIIDNLYGWWDPADYTGEVLGDQNDPDTGSPYLGVVDGSTIPSKSLGGSSTGNSLTVKNFESQADEAWEHIQLRDPAEGGSDVYKSFYWTDTTGEAGYVFNNSTVNPSGGKFTVMVWFKVDGVTPQGDTTDLGLFDASLNSTSASTADQGLALDDISSAASRRLFFATRPNNEDWESKFQKWEDDEWTCIIISADPSADDGAGGTKAVMRHLIANQYTVDRATDTISGSGIVSDSDSITINANGTYIDYLFEDGDTDRPSEEGLLDTTSADFDSVDLTQQFTGFEFARQAAGWITSFDFTGNIGLMALWDGEAKSDTDMQTIFDYSKTQFGVG